MSFGVNSCFTVRLLRLERQVVIVHAEGRSGGSTTGAMLELRMEMRRLYHTVYAVGCALTSYIADGDVLVCRLVAKAVVIV